MGRPKKPSRQLDTIQDATEAMRDLLLMQLELEKQAGAMDLARAAATARFEKPVDAAKARIKDLIGQLHSFYMVHRAELEKGKKSVELPYGTMGCRLGLPKLAPLNRAWTWSAIAVKLRSIYAKKFFNDPPEPTINKMKVKADLNAQQLHDCGLKVEQEDEFFVDLDRTKLVPL